ncbi:hypothetical protein [Nonomuraea sp. NPDC052265]|uniref:hypothetical protein n=1 Tax=Nonomuraea sp. NPDC052265 TaxID=3364374 RepID=UPI0037CAC785
MIAVWRTIFAIGCSLNTIAVGMMWVAYPARAPGAFPILVVGLVLTIVGAIRMLTNVRRADDDDNHER